MFNVTGETGGSAELILVYLLRHSKRDSKTHFILSLDVNCWLLVVGCLLVVGW